MSLLQLYPNQADSRLVGIARLASQAEHVDSGHQVEFFSLPVRSILNRCDSHRNLPFTWTINPYRGCEFACKYCYARYTHEFMEIRDPNEFEHKIFVKDEAAWLLRRDLKKVRRGEEIAIGTATDPYQPAERRHGVTRSILEEFARHSGLEIGIVTKSNLVLRDIDVLQRVAEQNTIGVHVTVTTVNIDLARITEPRAPRPDLRLEAVRKLNEAGIRAGVICAPVLPDITDKPRDLEALVKAAAEAGATNIFANPLFLKPCSRSVFLPFIEQKFPDLVPRYQQLYGERDFGSQVYRKHLSALMAKFKKKYGIGAPGPRGPIREYAPPKLAEQLTLF
ncbi:MAG: radical SAM protein [Acidobacteria bacterium]|nr:MAG: radical SAM protein [Acidobacteriota bacterium]PYY17325.1 MAG: radical SAM protein [Acidobacteriota bacterium]